eukprot:TRINITY_DN42692_c0_g1_i1.p1 TRINITY_DN42692_c0_g1~~TRINITY_DN42692_c0_g1_i1.p1  ORF type:complete len:494 (+),score=92.24 TRINITY_DN42692_c0_g1_i1:217-1698(+)
MATLGHFKHLALRAVGSEAAVLRAAFKVAESRASVDEFSALLGRTERKLPWKRSWAENAPDRLCYWESEEHRAADGRTPLMSVFQAMPRHALLARLEGQEALSAEEVKRAPRSLTGFSAAELAKGHVAGAGDAARAGLQTWRREAAGVLLAVGGGAMAKAADYAGRTALHYAAVTGDSELVTLLLACGADACAVDALGRTAAHVAAACGPGREVAAEMLLAATAEARAAAQLPDAHGRSVAGILEVQAEARERRRVTGVEILPDACSPDVLFEDYVALNRPVVVKGGAAHLPAMREWSTPERLNDALQGLPLATGMVPYDRATGVGAMPVSALPAAPSGTTGTGLYAFDVQVGLLVPSIHRQADLFPEGVRDQYLSYLRQPQFGVGMPGAGAPLHVHHAALNALFAGKKRWWITSPDAAFWSRQPMASWKDSAALAELRRRDAVHEVLQEAGDLLFVPEGWAHATLLERGEHGAAGFGVGIGQEFIPKTSLFS